MIQKEPMMRSLFDDPYDTDSSRALSVTFTIPYHTDPSSHLVVSGESTSDDTETFTSDLSQIRPGVWQTTVELKFCRQIELRYTYTVQDGDTILRSEPLRRHALRLHGAPTDHSSRVCIHDLWCDPSPMHRFMAQPLASLMGLTDLGSVRMFSAPTKKQKSLLFRTEYPLPGDLLLCGEHPDFGAWDPQKAVSLTLTRSGYLVEICHDVPFQYKLVLRQSDGTLLWESGENRHHIPAGDSLDIVSEIPPLFPSIEPPKVKQIEGTVLPMFSLRTDRSYGVGDLGDAVEFVHWLKKVGQQIYQLLPIYDTIFTGTTDDTYPYNAITTFGIHPIYMDVRRLPYYLTQKKRKQWEKQAKALNALPTVDYLPTLELKLEVIRECLAEWIRNNGNDDPDFHAFCKKYHEDLLPYCRFCFIRDSHPGKQVKDYPKYSTYSETHKDDLTSDPDLLPYAYTQYYLYRQLRELHDYAKKAGIALKGDLPIGVGRNSVDMWQHPEYFHSDRNAGSPPDGFAANGQNWGFPTYDWDAIAQKGYIWWRRRFSAMQEYMSMIRVDHILGFFRIWSIPTDSGHSGDGYYVPGIGYPRETVGGLHSFFTKDPLGLYHPTPSPQLQTGYHTLTDEDKQSLHILCDDYYRSRNENLWRSTAYRRLLGVLDTTNMLICAEDLGVLPHTIHEVLKALELATLEVIRMPKKTGSTYVLPKDIAPLSVLTTSTHDMPSLRGWWSGLEPEQRKELATLYGFEQELTPAGLVRALRHMPSRLLILPLQDWCVLAGYGSEVDPQAEQINRPSDPHNIWNYRMYGTIDKLPTKLT